MDRASMIEALKQLGFNTDSINDSVPDEFIAQVLASLMPPDAGAGSPAAPAAPPVTPMSDRNHKWRRFGDEEGRDDVDASTPCPDPNQPVSSEQPDGVTQMADMTRDDMIQALVGKGHAVEELSALDDATLQQVYAAEFPAEPAPEQTPGVTAMDDVPTREDLIAALVQAGVPQEQLDSLSDDELAAMIQSMSSGPAPAASTTTAMSDRRRFSESNEINVLRNIIAELVGPELASIRASLNAAKKTGNELVQNQKRANVRAFCEALRDEGKLLPSEFSLTFARLMRADNTQVRRFSENGKTVRKTELDLQMQELRARPILVTFAERMGNPIGTADHEVRKIENHFQKFSEQFKRAGTTQDRLVKAFKIARENDKHLTADAFLGNR